MPRSTWFAPAAVLSLALAIGSCASNDVKCPTCPPEDSARLEVFAVIDLDSVHVKVDDGPVTKVTFLNRHVFGGLAPGEHRLSATIYRVVDFVPTTTDVSLRIVLARGEARTVLFHHDFAGVVQALPATDDDRPLLAHLGAAIRRTRAG
jgi:hypothetical protein